MDLIENIRIFKRVAESGNFSAAAKDLQITQPTVSKAVQALETRLSVTLLRRTTRGLHLTPDGQKLLLMSGNLLDQVELIYASLHNQAMQLEGKLRLSTSVAFSRLVLAPWLASFYEAQPRLRLHFHLSDGFVDLVEQGIDVAIRIGDLADSSLKAMRIGTSRRSLYATAGYLEKHGIPKTLEELRSHRLLYYTRLSDQPKWPLVDKAQGPVSFAFEPYLETDGSDLMREACLEHIGIALMPTWMMGEAEREGRVQKILKSISTEATPIYAVTPPAKYLSIRQKVVIDFLRQHMEKHNELSPR